MTHWLAYNSPGGPLDGVRKEAARIYQPLVNEAAAKVAPGLPPPVLAFERPDMATRDGLILGVDLATATGTTPANIERVAARVNAEAGRFIAHVSVGPDDCARCGHWRKEHGNKGFGGEHDACGYIASGPDGAPQEGAECDCPAFVHAELAAAVDREIALAIHGPDAGEEPAK